MYNGVEPADNDIEYLKSTPLYDNRSSYMHTITHTHAQHPIVFSRCGYCVFVYIAHTECTQGNTQTMRNILLKLQSSLR